MSKSVYDKIKEAQIAGTFEGTMRAAGKEIRYFSNEWFESHSAKEMAQTLNQDEYQYYQAKVHNAVQREQDEREATAKKRIMDFWEKVESDKQRFIKIIIDKQSRLPQPNRIPEDKIKQDIKHLVGEPYTGDFSYLDKLREYAGEIEQGNNPDVKIGENK